MLKKKGLIGFLILTMVISSMVIGAPVVKAADNTPDFSITRSMDKAEYLEGETGTITYKITPSGSVAAPTRTAADITLILDLSGSMAPWVEGGYAYVPGHYDIIPGHYNKWGRWISESKVWVSDSWAWVDGHNDTTKLDGMKAAAKAFVQNIKTVNTNTTTKDRISIIGFNMNIKTSKEFSSNYDSLITYIDTLSAEGWTNYDDAMRRADTGFNNSTTKSKFAVLFSDGEPTHYHNFTNSNYSDEPRAAIAALSTAKVLSKDKITLYTIGLGSGAGINMTLLQDIATAGGGKAYQANEASQLNSLFSAISSDIVSTRFSDVRVIDAMPADFTIIKNDSVITINTDNTFETKMPDIVFTSGQGTPLSVEVKVDVVFNKSGHFSLDKGSVKYSDIQETGKTKPIDSIYVNVYDKTPPTAPKLSKTPSELTNKDVVVTVEYPSDAVEKTYRKGNGSFMPYPVGGIIISENCTVYASCRDAANNGSKEGSIVVDNIDKIKPEMPTISSDPIAETITKDPVKISIAYPSDVSLKGKEYRLNETDPWLAYTGIITVSKNGTKIEARATDAAGNISDIASYTVSNIYVEVPISFTSIEFKFEGGMLQTSAVRKGTLVPNLIFKTTGVGKPEFVLTCDSASVAFFEKIDLKGGIKKNGITTGTMKDSTGNLYDLTLDSSNHKLTVKSQTSLTTNGAERSIKIPLYIQSDAPYSAKNEFFTLLLEGKTGNELKVRIVRNPKLY